MKIVVAKKPLRRLLRWTQRVLFASAVAMLGYCGFVLLDAWIFQKGERRQLERLLHDRRAVSDARPQIPFPSPPKHSPPPVTGDLIGRIEIPHLGLSVIVVEGTDRHTLRRGAGHIPGSALPGQLGNAAITGHRDTFFRPLRNIQQNDIVTLTTLRGEYRYRVVSITIVSPRDVGVLDPSENEILTLITCYPFYFVGPAPSRFIVRAERVAG